MCEGGGGHAIVMPDMYLQTWISFYSLCVTTLCSDRGESQYCTDCTSYVPVLWWYVCIDFM